MSRCLRVLAAVERLDQGQPHGWASEGLDGGLEAGNDRRRHGVTGLQVV